MTDPATFTNTKPISGGDFLLFRKDGKKLRRLAAKGAPAGKAYTPRFRHPTYEAAEVEAKRLLAQMPASTFIILREVGRLKVDGVAA